MFLINSLFINNKLLIISALKSRKIIIHKKIFGIIVWFIDPKYALWLILRQLYKESSGWSSRKVQQFVKYTCWELDEKVDFSLYNYSYNLFLFFIFCTG